MDLRIGQMPSDYGQHWMPEATWADYGTCTDCGAEPGRPCRNLTFKRFPQDRPPTWRAHPGRPLLDTLPPAGRYEAATVPTRYAAYPMLDFPTAWRLARRGLVHTSRHCSYVQTWGGALCDCGAVEAEYRRIYDVLVVHEWEGEGI